MSVPPNMTRRAVVTSAAAAALVSWPRVTAAASSPISGTVFHDRGRSGQRHAGDPGIAGVLVSNGIDVVATDAQGRWQLPAIPGDLPFVIKPTGWALRSRDNGLPDFWRDCAQSDGIDFPLYPTDEPSRFDVALLGDTQPQSERELDFLRDTVFASVLTSGAALAINHGDIVFDRPELYPRYLRLIGASGIPWHHCPGNHDMDFASDPMRCFTTWRRVFGPCHSAFQHGGATFIVLNNLERLPANGVTTSGHGYRGGLGARQLAFVRNLLARVPHDQLVVLSMHIPLIGLEDPHDAAGKTRDAAELLRLLSGRPHTLSLAGHTHTTEHHYLGAEDGFSGPGHHHHHVLTAACGSWWSGPFDGCGMPISDSRDGTPKGYHLLSVEGNRYTTQFVPVGAAGSAQMRLSIQGRGHAAEPGIANQSLHERLNPVLSREQLSSATLVANVFDGGPRTAVGFRFAARPSDTGSGRQLCQPMSRRPMIDPYTAEAFCRHRQEIKSWVQPAVSSHVWQSSLPDDLAVGVHQIIVEGSDEYGRPLRAAMMIEVSA